MYLTTLDGVERLLSNLALMSTINDTTVLLLMRARSSTIYMPMDSAYLPFDHQACQIEITRVNQAMRVALSVR